MNPRPRIEPVTWNPPPPSPRTAPSPLSVRTVRLPGTGPEDVLVDDDGTVLTGLVDGRVLRVTPDGRSITTVADTGGRPLGLEWLPDHTLLVCDAERGLLQVGADGTVRELVTEADGKRLRFCNNAAVAPDGTVYFTDSSARFGVQEWKADLLEHSATGRLLRRDPDGSVAVLATGLAFPNGVALQPDGRRLVVAEMWTYKLLTMDLPSGELTDWVLLPGFADNISTGSDGLIWVAVASPRDPVVDLLATKPPVLRKIVWALPDALQPKPKKLIRIQAYDGEGQLVQDLLGTDQDFHLPTGVREHHGTVWLGSLERDYLATFDKL